MPIWESWSRWTDVLVIVKPDTVIGWHRAGFRIYWRWRSRSRGGRPKIRVGSGPQPSFGGVTQWSEGRRARSNQRPPVGGAASERDLAPAVGAPLPSPSPNLTRKGGTILGGLARIVATMRHKLRFSPFGSGPSAPDRGRPKLQLFSFRDPMQCPQDTGVIPEALDHTRVFRPE
jgi:hypothetical protein